jgi:hypothetical protein
MNRVCERMIKCVGNELTFRVWVTADQEFNVDTSKLQQMLESLKSIAYSEENIKYAICNIEKLDNIAAIEILNNYGNGILLYPNWN